MKKTVALLFSLLFLILCFFGCQDQGAKSEDTTSGASAATTTAGTTQAATTGSDPNANKSLVVWYQKLFATEANDAFEARVEQFAREKGVEVKLEMLDGTQLPILFNAGIEAGARPDISITADYIALHLFPDPPFLDLSDFIGELEQANGRSYTPSQRDGCFVDGKAYRIGFSSSSAGLHYRKDYLAAAGITTEPETWADVFEMSALVTDASNGIYGLGFGCGPADNDGEDFLRALIWSYGGALFDSQGNPDPLNPKNIEALQLFLDCVLAGNAPPTITSWDDSTNNTSYLTGESCFVFNAFTLYNACKSPGNEELLSNTAVTGMPSGPTGIKMNVSAPTGFSIFKDSSNIELAKEFLLYITEKDWYNSFFTSLAPVMAPVFDDTTEDPLWQDPVNHLAIEYSMNHHLYGYPADTIFQGKSNGVTVKNQYLLNRAMQRCIIEGMSLEDSLSRMKDEMLEAVK